MEKKHQNVHCTLYRNDFDWSEESLSPGAGWGEYVEEYEVSLLSFADDFNSWWWRYIGHQGLCLKLVLKCFLSLMRVQLKKKSN